MTTQRTALKTMFSYPFRIFFLSAAVMALLLVPLWLWFLSGDSGWMPALPGMHWHQHEMLAGFLNAAIAGFLLTAVCAWTGTRPVAGATLAGLWIVWLAGRVALMWPGDMWWPALVIDLAFLPAVALLVAIRVLPLRQWRQLPLLGVIALLWMADLAFHLDGDSNWLRVIVVLAAVLILVVGGRITPVFSRNWLQGQGGDGGAIRSTNSMDTAVLVTALALVAAQANPALPGAVTGAVALIAALAAALRLWMWRGWLVRREPLLLVLHIGGLWVVAGFLLRALAAWDIVADSAWLHALGAGAAGTMILGVMARVALGHTGRPLTLPAGMATAFWLIFTAATVRVATALNWLDWTLGLYLSAALWCAAFALFCWRYLSVLLGPRIDGKEG